MTKNSLLNFLIASDAIFANKFRSMLTALGIIFGVAAVIAMLAIGKGAEKEIMEQIRLVGVNNIVVTPVDVQSEEETGENQQEVKRFTPGLTLLDVKSIEEVLPVVDRLSPEIILETAFVREGLRRSGKLVGVNPDFFEITGFKLIEGNMFSPMQMERAEQVCIIGADVKTRFFKDEDPVGKYIKSGKNWLRVIGVLEPRTVSGDVLKNLGLRNYNLDIYTPINTMLVRYINRSLVTKAMIQARDEEENENEEPTEVAEVNYHQLDRLVIQVEDTETLRNAAQVISRLLERRHNGVVDFEVSVPELMLKQQQRNKEIFNIVLGAIAGISLLVGGIGIMNIMLASVYERIKEIGLRLSLGATKQDIIQQFLFEAVLISLTGGITGVIIGVAISEIISGFFGIETVITAFSIFLSFGVATFTGLVFGLIPARRAAEQDPISSLRHE